jgi:hypothetical protein
MKKTSVIIMVLILFLVIPMNYANATITTIQPSEIDSYIDEYFPVTNYGTEASLDVSSYTYDARSLVKFDLSSIPPSAIINSATLKLYLHAVGSTNGRTFWAYRLTQSWTEGGVTWNRYDGSNTWTTQGGDYTTADGSSSIVPNGGWTIWDVTSIVKSWVEGGLPNNGFLIRDGDESSTTYYHAQFYSKDEATSNGLRPILEVDYTLTSKVVGGEIHSVNNFAILTPYIMIVLTSTAIVLMINKYRKQIL